MVVVDLRERFGAREEITRSIIEHSSALIGLSLLGLVGNFRARLNKSVDEAFYVGSVGSECHADTAIDGVSPRFSEGAVSHDDDGSTREGGALDLPAHPDVIKL